MKKVIQLLLVMLICATTTLSAQRGTLMRQGASRNLVKPKSVKPKSAKQKSADIDKQLRDNKNPSSSIPANTPAKAKKTLGEKTHAEKAADYRKQQGLDVRSARPKNGDVKGAQKREDADEAAEAARAKGFNAKTSTPVDKSKSKVERMTGTTPTNINKSTQVTGQPNAKLNPANPSSSGKTPKMATAPTQSQKAAEYRKQQGLDVKSARPKNGDVKGAQKREDADEAAEAARVKAAGAPKPSSE